MGACVGSAARSAARGGSCEFGARQTPISERDLVSILIGTGPSDLYDAATELLSAAGDAVATTVGGAIGRQLISPGLPVVDCVQLSVHVGAAALANTAPLQPPLQPMVREGANRAVRLVQFTITPARCVPVIGNVGPKFPSPASISQAALEIDSDLWAIWNHLAYLKRNGLLFPPAKTRAMSFDPAVPLNTAGGFGGFQLQVSVEMPGYPE